MLSGNIADGNTDPGRAVFVAGDFRKSCLGLNQQVVGLEVTQRPFIAIAGDRTGDQPRIAPPEIVRCKPQPFNHTRGKVLDKHIGLGNNCRQHLLVCLELEIETQ